MRWPFRRSRRPKPYLGRHFANREKYREDYRALAGYLLEAVEFDSVLDVGCANGFLLEEFLSAAKRVQGIELSEEVREFLSPALLDHVMIGDFSVAVGSWDLVCCIEVAEHLEPERSEDLVAKLCSSAERAIYFTAARPGQTGHGHINCRPPAEWLAWFSESGWQVDEPSTKALRERMKTLDTAHWLGPNSFLFTPERG